ncbi:MAG: DUF4440 domain-containing protein [Gemmatimonadales bacterium]|nr:DUF4440 domain-containing protein [Gemmatimonadales bacterium]
MAAAALGLVLVAAACRRPAAPASAPGDAAPRAAPAPLPTEIRGLLDRYVEASNRRDIAALVALYADDAYLLPPDHALIAGRAAIAAFWRDALEPGLVLEPVAVELRDDRATVIGRYTLPATLDQPADSGKCVLLLGRATGGGWHVRADIWNGSTAPPADEPLAPGEERRERERSRVIS